MVTAALFLAAHVAVFTAGPPAPTATPVAFSEPQSTRPQDPPAGTARQDDVPYPDRPLTHIFQNLGHDLVRFPALDTLVILGAGGAAATVAHNSDDKVNRWTLDHPAGSWTRIGRIGGDGFTMGGLAIGTWAVGEWTDHR